MTSSQTRITKVVVKDEAPAKKKPHENEQYFMGYFKWYWGKHGFWNAFKSFIGKKFIYSIIYNLFNGVGLAIGTFYMKRYCFDRIGLSDYCLNYA